MSLSSLKQEKQNEGERPEEMRTAELPEELRAYLTVPIPYLPGQKELPDSYIVSQAAVIDTQGGNECCACACAYMLRFYGQKADYLELYDSMTLKMPNGYVYPKAIEVVFDGNEDLKAVFYNGTLEDLKDALADGIPQIVLVKTAPAESGLHYVTVVGYDKNRIYLQDSYADFRNEAAALYNRSVSCEEFEAIWSNAIPCMDHTFITVMTREAERS